MRHFSLKTRENPGLSCDLLMAVSHIKIPDVIASGIEWILYKNEWKNFAFRKFLSSALRVSSFQENEKVLYFRAFCVLTFGSDDGHMNRYVETTWRSKIKNKKKIKQKKKIKNQDNKRKMDATSLFRKPQLCSPAPGGAWIGTPLIWISPG